jgi:hypothetical protein
MLLYAYDSPCNWGKMFKEASEAQGIPCQLFRNHQDVPNNAVAFLRLDQWKGRRAQGKQMVSDLNARGVITLPTLRESVWYDDKVAQLPSFQQYMPATVVLRDVESAMDFLENQPYPFISKSTFGASSAGVRLIETPEQALKEVSQVFGKGIKTPVYNRVQKGYVYWQEFVEQNPCDYRVVVTGDKYYGLIRYNRKDVPFASGSGNLEVITELSGRTEQAFTFAKEVVEGVGSKWLALDIIFTPDNKPLLVEVSSAWKMGAYDECPMFTIQNNTWLKCDDLTAKDSFKEAVRILANE